LLQRGILRRFTKNKVFDDARIRTDLHREALEKYFDVVLCIEENPNTCAVFSRLFPAGYCIDSPAKTVIWITKPAISAN
jgi:hypothetical protein